MTVPDSAHVLEFDGAARGNPGPAGCGALLFAPANAGGHVIWAGSAYIGHGTNNTAEYGGGHLGIRAAARLPDLSALHCRGDSALVVRQVQGQWPGRVFVLCTMAYSDS